MYASGSSPVSDRCRCQRLSQLHVLGGVGGGERFGAKFSLAASRCRSPLLCNARSARVRKFNDLLEPLVDHGVIFYPFDKSTDTRRFPCPARHAASSLSGNPCDRGMLMLFFFFAKRFDRRVVVGSKKTRRKSVLLYRAGGSTADHSMCTAAAECIFCPSGLLRNAILWLGRDVIDCSPVQDDRVSTTTI